MAGAVGRTIRFGADLSQGSSGSFREMAALTSEMGSGRVSLLLVHGANPVHTLGGAFSQAWAKVGYKVSFSSYLDETAAGADLVLPDLHPLEQWNDSRPRVGVFALQQPAMLPVFDGPKQTGDVLLQLAGKSDTYKRYVQAKWSVLHQRLGSGTAFDEWWTTSVQHGGVYMDAPTRTTQLAPGAGKTLATAKPAVDNTVAVVFPHPVLHDGRGANKPWLQELPDPVSKVTWHAWVEVHPDTAQKWALASGDVLLIKSGFGAVSAPVWITPSVRPGVLALPTGQGHRAYGRYAQDRSFNAFDLLPSEPNPYGGRTHAVTVTVSKTADHRPLATTEGTGRHLGENIATTVTLAAALELKPGEHVVEEEGVPEYSQSAMKGWTEAQHQKASLGNYAGDHPRWGMAIDLTKCTGCSACVTACYAENNIPTVGEEQVLRGREMSLDADRALLRGRRPPGPLSARHPPMLCQQCDNAPCEPVCPVYAAYHTPDGPERPGLQPLRRHALLRQQLPLQGALLQLVQLRRAGRHLGAFPEPLNLQLNPDVTVRGPGVMEKCTFCVQRIRGAQNQARLEDRAVARRRDRDRLRAGLPVRRDRVRRRERPGSTRVTRWPRDPRGYHVLEASTRRPAVTYLAKVAPARRPDAMAVTPMARHPTADPRRRHPRRSPPRWGARARGTSCSWARRVALLPDRPRVPSCSCCATASASPATAHPVFWAVYITTFVFWVGIAHAGTLISAILFLFRSRVAHRGLPRHRGDDGVRGHDGRALPDHPHRPPVVLLLAAARIPNQRCLWPNFKSPLIWDVFAISTYLTVSTTFLFVGLMPDIAAVRDQATGWRKKLYSAPSLGWRGTDKQWRHYTPRLSVPGRPGHAAGALGALGGVLGLRHVASCRAGTGRSSRRTSWPAPSTPASRMVLTLMIPLRRLLQARAHDHRVPLRQPGQADACSPARSSVLRLRHGVLRRLVQRATPFEQTTFWRRAFGPNWWAGWTMIICNAFVSQLLWFKKIRTNLTSLFVISIFINIGMWFERYVIIVVSPGG